MERRIKMELTTHPFKSDTLTLTKEDLFRIERGEKLQVSALTIQLEKKPDQVVFPATASYRGENGYAMTVSTKEQLKLTFDGETGKLKSAEVLK
jgi:hypothetical protein